MTPIPPDPAPGDPRAGRVAPTGEPGLVSPEARPGGKPSPDCAAQAARTGIPFPTGMPDSPPSALATPPSRAGGGPSPALAGVSARAGESGSSPGPSGSGGRAAEDTGNPEPGRGGGTPRPGRGQGAS